MSAVPTVYQSSDTGAPVLSGSAGALAAVLDAVLVDGYGSKAPLGWLRPFSDGHKRVYRNDTSVGATGYCIRFNDSGSNTCAVSAYESMSDVDTGEGLFAAETTWPKSSNADATARNWVVVGTDRCVYLFIDQGGTDSLSRETGWFFGDMVPFGSTDVFAFAYSESYTTQSRLFSGLAMAGTATTYAKMKAARSYSGMPGGVTITNNQSLIARQTTLGGTGGLTYPYPSTNGAVLSMLTVHENNIWRARMPGAWVAEHNAVHNDGTIYSDFPDLPGTELLCKVCRSSRASLDTSPRILLDLTNAWF